MTQAGHEAMEEEGENLPALRTVFLKPWGEGRTVHSGGCPWEALVSQPDSYRELLGRRRGRLVRRSLTPRPGPQATLTPSQNRLGRFTP